MEVGNFDDGTSYMKALEAALDMSAFNAYAQKVLNGPVVCSSSSSSSSSSSGSEESDSDEDSDERDAEKAKHKQLLYNFSCIGPDRQWLKNVLMSDTSSSSEMSDEDEYIKEMLKNHVREKRIRERYHQNSSRAQYGYYSSSILSNKDVYEQHRMSILGTRRRKRKERVTKPEKPPKVPKVKKERKMKMEGDDQISDIMDPIDWEEHLNDMANMEGDGFDSKSTSPLPGSTPKPGMRGRRKSSFLKTPEAMAARRRKVWQIMSKKEIGKVQRAKVNNHKEMVTGAKRVATLCMKSMRQKAMQSQKVMKETMWRAKRLTREMQTYWKRYDRVERETKRRMEKEAEEQRKMDVELIEAKRQQRKLNFLITQTELYAHFMSKKLGSGSQEEQLRILSQLDEEANPRLATIDDYDSEMMKVKAQKNASDAYLTERARTKQFDTVLAATSPIKSIPVIKTDEDGRIVELPQPAMFRGKLKGYQIKGMTWLANLYDQGISGILADEMGLGKTVQSIALLCHIAENFGVWGPFLIISPASTLHNWQQEMERFVPNFRVVPYWGSPNERKILRQFWEQKDLHTKDASFHVVITSYQLVVSDYKYFNRIKWQYMVLDEAQAIKSSSSVRWKLLLGFNCRNRLLLSGTPIQNSMAELWALLHFIMPTLFDSHEEFNEWFSKDIESHAENKTGIDEKQISRLHMILKPFMLRRIKKDVENELSDKIEIMVYCPLTTRQRLLYMALKKKIRIEDLLQYSRGSNDGHHDKTVTSNLMNLVMQFRKVCNHPELFERRDSKSPYAMKGAEYLLPRLVFNEAFLERAIPSKKHLLYNKFSIYKAENVQRAMFPKQKGEKGVKYCRYVDLSYDNAFSFAGISNLTPGEIERLALGGLIYYFNSCQVLQKRWKLLAHRRKWWFDTDNKAILIEPTFMQPLSPANSCHESILHELLFTAYSSKDSTIYTHTTHMFHSMSESMEHRIIRSKHQPFVKLEPKIEEPIHETRLRSPMKSPTKSPIKAPLNQQLTIKTPNKAQHNSSGPKSPSGQLSLVSEFPYRFRPPALIHNYKTEMPPFICSILPRIQTRVRKMYCESREAAWLAIRTEQADNPDGQTLMETAIDASKPVRGWSNVSIPDKQTLVSDAGKLAVLDSLLTRLKAENHRVLIYSQMTKMIDLLEEYMWHRKHRYMRLDGSSKISARRDMVADFQTRQDIFVFLLSTRAGGLGINLTAADTVIFYDSDWNPTVDQQAMDRAHRLGQTKQVTVYRLICKGTIEERILQRAREKSEIQRMVISGGNFKPDTLKPKEVVSLLLDDEEIVTKYRQKTEEKKSTEDVSKADKEREKKRKQNSQLNKDPKRPKVELLDAEDLAFLMDSGPPSPALCSENGADNNGSNDSSNEALVVDCDRSGSNTPVSFLDGIKKPRRRHHPRGTRRGRPRGTKRGGCSGGGMGRSDPNAPLTSQITGLPIPPPIKRGPGRPRTKPPTPKNQGHRGPGAPRGPRKQKPLVVPLGQSPMATPLQQSPAVSRPTSPGSAEKASISFYQSTLNDNN